MPADIEAALARVRELMARADELQAEARAHHTAATAHCDQAAAASRAAGLLLLGDPYRAHVVYCRGCQHAWAELDGDECGCICTDDTDPHYEDWVTDPDPDDIPEGAWS